MKKVLIIVLAVLVLGLAIAGFVVFRNSAKYISKQAALDLAINDAGIDTRTIVETDVDFEKNPYSAVYEVEIETAGKDYEYVIDAVTGEILGSRIDR